MMASFGQPCKIFAFELACVYASILKCIFQYALEVSVGRNFFAPTQRLLKVQHKILPCSF